MKAILVIVALLIGICAWAPWMKPEVAVKEIQKQFDTEYRANKPLYSGDCTLLTMTPVRKTNFGYKADVTYTCELTGDGAGEVMYMFYDSVTGVPAE